MEITYIQLLYLGVLAVNLIMLAIMLTKTKKSKIVKKKPHRGNDSDDEGGLEEIFDPILDLPPGVILPTDKPVKEREPVL